MSFKIVCILLVLLWHTSSCVCEHQLQPYRNHFYQGKISSIHWHVDAPPPQSKSCIPSPGLDESIIKDTFWKLPCDDYHCDDVILQNLVWICLICHATAHGLMLHHVHFDFSNLLSPCSFFQLYVGGCCWGRNSILPTQNTTDGFCFSRRPSPTERFLQVSQQARFAPVALCVGSLWQWPVMFRAWDMDRNGREKSFAQRLPRAPGPFHPRSPELQFAWCCYPFSPMASSTPRSQLALGQTGGQPPKIAVWHFQVEHASGSAVRSFLLVCWDLWSSYRYHRCKDMMLTTVHQLGHVLSRSLFALE